MLNQYNNKMQLYIVIYCLTVFYYIDHRALQVKSKRLIHMYALPYAYSLNLYCVPHT